MSKDCVQRDTIDEHFMWNAVDKKVVGWLSDMYYNFKKKENNAIQIRDL